MKSSDKIVVIEADGKCPECYEHSEFKFNLYRDTVFDAFAEGFLNNDVEKENIIKAVLRKMETVKGVMDLEEFLKIDETSQPNI